MRLRSPNPSSGSLTLPQPLAFSNLSPAPGTLSEQIALVSQTTQALGFAIDRDSALDTVGSALLRMTGAETVAAYIVERGGLQGPRVYAAGSHTGALPASLTVPMDWQHHIVAESISRLPPEVKINIDSPEIHSYVAAPLHHGAIFLGVVLALSREPIALEPASIELIRLLMTQLASFLDSRELFSVLEDYALEMAQLNHLTRISTSSLERDRVAADVTLLLSDITQVDAVIALREGDTLQLFANGEPNGQRLNLAEMPELNRLLDSKQDSFALITLDTSGLSPAMSAWLCERGGEALMVLPMVANQENQGFILLVAPNKQADFERRAPVLEMAANQIALQVFNARGYQHVQDALRQRLEELSLIEDIARRITTVLNPDEIGAQVLRAALSATAADAAALTLANDEGRFVTLRLEREKTGTILRHSHIKPTRDMLPPWLRQVLSRRAPQLIPDLRSTEAGASTLMRSFAAAPLDRDGEAVGTLSVESAAANRFTAEHLSFLSSLAGHAGISLQNADLLEEHQAQIVALRNLQALAMELTGVQTTGEVARAALDAAMAMLSADEGTLYHQDKTGKLTLVVSHSASGPVRHKVAMSRAALQALTDGGVSTRVYDRGKSTTVSLPIRRPTLDGSYALCLYFGHGRVVRPRDTHHLLILSSYVGGQFDNTSLNEQVRAANARMRTILDTTPSAILMLNPEGVVVDVNRSAELLLGLDSHTTLGKHISAVFMGLMSSGGIGLSQTAVAEFADRLRSDPERMGNRQIERTIGASSQYLTELLSPVRNESGEVVGHLLVYRDVSEQIRSAQYREQVTHMVIHDLRGPLWSIISGIDLAQDDLRVLPEAEQTVHLLEISARSAQNLMRLVESLLDISRLEQGQFPLNRAPVSPADLVDSALAALTGAVNEAPITLTVETDPSLPLIDVDHDMMRRVLINLMDNALRHTPMQGRILVRAFARRGDILFLVADSGPGIPLDERERVFERYRQVPQNRPQRGSKGQGLGLAFCKLAVEAHGGTIQVEPHGPLPGAVFSVSIPIWRGD